MKIYPIQFFIYIFYLFFIIKILQVYIILYNIHRQIIIIILFFIEMLNLKFFG